MPLVFFVIFSLSTCSLAAWLFLRNITAWPARDDTTEFSRPIDWVFKAGLPHPVVRFVHCTKHLDFKWS